jgi:hypothetical protein
VVTGALERFTVGNLVPVLCAVSILRLVVTEVGTLRSTFCTSSFLQKRVKCIWGKDILCLVATGASTLWSTFCTSSFLQRGKMHLRQIYRHSLF